MIGKRLPWLGLGVAWTCLFLALGIGRSLPGVAGYEPSIYAVFPVSFWVAIGIAMAAFVALLTMRDASNAVLLGSFLGLLLVATTLSGLPHLRGYEDFGRGDVATHTADLRNLLAVARPAAQDFYPAAKLYAASLVLLGGVPEQLVELVASVAIGATYAFGSVLLARRMLGTTRWDGVVLAGAAIPAAGAYVPSLVPAAFGVALAPLTLALLLPGSTASPATRVARVVLTLSIAFIHPLVALLMLGALLCVRAAYAVRLQRKEPSASDVREPLDTAFALLSVSLVAWITAFSIFDTELTIIRNAVLAGIGGAAFASSFDLAGRAGFSVLDTLSLALRMNIGVILALAVGLPAAFVAFTKTGWGGSRRVLGAVVGICLLLVLGTVVNGLVLLDLDVFRFVHLFALVIPVLLALAASVFASRRRIIATVMITGVGIASVPFMIPSPYTYQTSDHIPPGELQAITWLGNQPAEGTLMSFLSLRRLAELAFPDPEDVRRQRVASAIRAPDHFGQWTGLELPEGSETSAIWLIVFDSDRDAYRNLWRAAGRFTAEDFAQLDRDSRISLVYTNAVADVYRIDSQAFQELP